MRFSGWLGSVHSIFRRRLLGFASRKQRHLRDARKDLRQVETLEQRRVLAFDFVSAYVADDSPFYVTNVTTDAELAEAPQQLTLRFTPGVEIDPTSLGGVSIVRSGGADDPFGTAGSFEEIAVAPGALLVDDFPSQNQVVIRFAETLPDDIYRITLSSTVTQDPETQADVVTGLKTITGEAFRGGDSFSFDVRLSLGQQVAAVVPQPITRDPDDLTAGLSQDRDVIEVYFDRSESLNQTSAETAGFYRLIAVNEATGADEPASEKNPTSVVYDPAEHKASLTFASGDLADGKLYRLEIGGPGILAAPVAVAETLVDHDSFTTAQSLGPVSVAGLEVSGSIDPRAEIALPGDLPSLYYPTQDGTIDEPGHRDVPIDDSNHGLPSIVTTAPPAPGSFSIDLSFGAGLTDTAIALAEQAAARWERVIVGDLTDQFLDGQLIDDILIHVQAGLLGDEASDGPSDTLANARPVRLRGAGDANPFLPYTGEIGIDMADVDNTQLFEIMVHEMGHALGFTSASIDLGLIVGDGFVGANAVREYLSLGVVAFANAVPLETEGGSGTAGAHWDEAEFNNELMTGYINNGVNPLSRITVGAFDDMGYVVDYAQADPYLNLLPEPLGTAGVIHTIPFNFRSDYGSDPQGNPLQNAITAEQQLRVREIFDLFSRYAGIRFVETANEGITVATGDTRVISDNTPTTSVKGLARGGIDNGTVSGDALAIVNSNIDWGESEYGGGYFREAIRQIGQVLGLWHSYDVPSIMGESLPGENVFPSDYDILHLQQFYPRAGTEIDVYSFTLADDGQFQAETFAQRLLAEASTLDTVLSIYDVSGRLISRNDDSFGRDSRVALELTAGDYYVAVSSTGNTSFNLDVTNNGLGGFTQGAYDLRLEHTPVATAATTIVDASGTPLDGDRDGKAGGAFNFHFRTAAAADTIYVDKIATDVLADVNTAADGTAEIELDNTSGIVAGMLVFGEGVPEGTTVLSNDSATEVTLSAAVTVSAATKLRFVTPGDGTLANPYLTIADALAAATSSTAIIRVLGNDGSELTGTSNNSGRPSLRPNVLVNELDPYHYYVGYDRQGNPLADGANLTVPAGVTLMLDAGATFRMAAANVEVGSSSELVSRAGAALQVLGTPTKAVTFSSTLTDQGYDDTTPTQVPRPRGGDWGGIVLRADSDWQPAGSLAHDTLRPVLNSISNAEIIYAGGQVVVDAEVQSFAAIQIEDTRPTVAFSTVTYSAGPAVSATPNSFEESNGRIGPEFRGNTLLANSTNGVFIAIATEFGSPLDKLYVSARFASTEVTYVLQESLVIAGGAGSYYEDEAGLLRARPSGRLQIDPGVVVKLQSSRIELERGGSQLIAEGVGNDRVIFTSFADNRFGAGGDFDTNGNLPNKFDEFGNVIDTLTTGDWGGIMLNAGASASIADAYLTFGGGEVPLEGGLDDFNVIEVHQADLRLVDTRIEANASGLAETSRNYRGTNEAATIFVRGAQPIIVGNDFRNNAGAMISANVNSLNDREQGDSGRQTGPIDRYLQFEGNRGPLLRANRISNDTTDGRALAGLAVRAEEITVEGVWDDTDIVHVVTDEIIVNNFHTATGLRLESDPAASLVVKLDGPSAGFTASGELLDIDDRIGGTVQVVGQPGFPVVLTSLADDTVGASVDLLGFPVTDTNGDGTTTTPASGDWRSLQFLPLANDRNVAIVNESELAYTSGQDDNNVIISAEALGILAPNYATGTNTWESAQEKTGDENRRQGFEVHGAIAYDDPTDVDIYTFDGYAGSEVWIDVDKTSSSLDTMVELLDASGRVLARSADSQTDTGSVTGVTVQADAGGLATVAGEQAAVIGTAAAATGVGAQVDGIDVTVTGVAARATGYQAQVIGIGAQATQAVVAGGENIVLDDATGVRIGATTTLDGVIAPGSQVIAINGNTITLDQQLVGNLNQNDWITFDISGITAFESSRIVFDVTPEVGVWVGDELSGNTVQSIVGVDGNIAVLGQAIAVDVLTNELTATQGFPGGYPYAVHHAPTNANTGVQAGGFYRFTEGTTQNDPDDGTGRSVSFANATVSNWQTLTARANVRYLSTSRNADGFVFVLQNSAASVVAPSALLPVLTSSVLDNQIKIHLDNYNSGAGQADVDDNHLSVTWGSVHQSFALPFDWDDGSWRDVEIAVSPNLFGVPSLNVTVDGISVVAGFLLNGYSLGQPTRFQVGARSGAEYGKHDIDNMSLETVASQNQSTTSTRIGLNGARSTDGILLDNATPIQGGSTVNGTATEVTDIELLGGASAVNAEPNDTLSTAYRTPIAITAGGLTSQFVQTGFIGDGTNTSRDVDMYRLSLPASAAGATMTLEGSTVGLDPAVAMSDVYLRVFDATGTVVAFDNDSGPGLDSSITFTIPGTYDGSGYFVGVSGFANSSYDPRVSGSGIAGSTGSYILRGTFDAPFNVGIGGGEGVVTLDNPVTVSDDQILTFSLAPGQTVSTNYITVDDASQVAVGAQITGAAGIPDGTTVTAVDLATNTLQLSQPISISLNDLAGIGFVDATVTVADASTLAEGMTVIGDGIPAGTTIAASGINGNEVTLSQPVDVADGQFLQFGFLGAAITTDTLYLDDTAATVGATVAAAGDPATTLATVTALDGVSGAIELDAPVTIADGDLLIFSFAGQPVSSRRVALDPATVTDATKIASPVLVNLVGANALDQNIPDGTTVVGYDVVAGSSILELSGSATVRNGDSLGFGFAGTTVVLGDIDGIDIGEFVTGPGVPAGTSVVDTAENNAGLPPNTVVLSQAVNVEDATALTFNVQDISVLDAAGAAGVAVLPGTLTGVLYDGNQAIQTFTSNRDGTLTFTAVGNPASRATSGTIDYATGGISLTFNTPPRRAIELRDVAFEYSNLTLETLGFAFNANTSTWENGAFPLAKDTWRGGDYYTTNPRDAGMRVTLPGTQGSQHKYFIRVRSQPAVGADAASHEANLVNEGLVNDGQTSGSYELRVRTRQRDDKPGSTVQYADIRYPQIGIDVLGLPNNSPLVGTTGEHPNDNNDTRGNAQQVGNLLTSDRNTISIAGAISDEADIDWYQFSLTYEDIQSLFLHNSDTKTWATVFDIDYADGFRGDLTLSVFDSSGALIYVGRDSNITDDQPGPGQGNDFDDLSRGSLGVLDPFIGSVQLPAGSTTPMTYYVAVSSNERLPSTLDQTFESVARDPLARLEPVTSVARVVEDHIGATGYESSSTYVDSPGIIDVTDLSANVREFTLADVTLYVTTGGSLYTYNPMTGDRISTIAESYPDQANTTGDIDMRTDGRMFAYVGSIPPGGDAANVGLLRELDPATGDTLSQAGDGIPSVPDTPGVDDWWKITGSTVDALAIRRTGVGVYENSIYYSVREGVNSILFHAQSNGNAAVGAGWVGRRGQITGEGVVGQTTGLQFLQDTGALYGVSSGGQFYRVNPGTGEATNVVDFSALIQGEGGFQGLAAGPFNLYEGALRDTLFAITGSGKLVCIDPTGASDGSAALIDNLFDTTQFIDTDGNGVADTFRKDGIGDSYISEATIGGARGLAFSPLDINLWHDTSRRSGDLGHGILGTGQTPPDNSRNVDFIRPGWGGSSMYFGLEESIEVGSVANQFGVQNGGNYNWLADLTSGPIGGNYDVPGGAHGSLITNSFSLAGTEYADKPTLYFTYFLETEGADAAGGMRDSARVFGSVDGGLTWTLLATNNSVENIIPGYELPLHRSVSSRIGTAEQQRVQELFDSTGTWRQARVDLGEFAGESNIQLRFDFATAGEMETADISNVAPDAKRVVDGNGGVLTATSVVPLDSVAGLEVGMIVRSHAGTTIDSGRVGPLDSVVDVVDTTISSIDVANNTITLAAPVSTLAVGAELSFFKELPLKNNILGDARSAGDNSNGNNARGLNNAFEGFYIDDIIVGFAERGEMITSSSSNLTTFYDIGTPIRTQYPEQTLEGEYQLEIRRGTEYGSTDVQTTTSDVFAHREISVDRTFHTNDRFITASASAALVLAENSLSDIDGDSLVRHGNGAITANGSSVRFDDAATAGSTTHSMLGWHVELAGQPSAFLNFVVTLGAGKVVRPLPDSFTYNAWDESVPANQVVGLPAGDGVAVSLDGGRNWQTVDNFAWTGSRVVDLVSQLGPLTDSTVIGFFRSGEADALGDDSIAINSLVITESPVVGTTGFVGDANNNHELEQGQFVIQSNIITAAASYGVRIDAGRDTETDPDQNYNGTTNAPHLGVARSLPVLNNSRLVPGVVISNNVVNGSGAGAVLFSGAGGTASVPTSVVPYGRIFNNTFVAGESTAATGIVVEQEAGPTILNNVFAGFATGVNVDGGSALNGDGGQRTVISTSAFYNVGTEVAGATQTQGMTLTTDPFVDRAAGNFYPTANAPIVDSSLNSLQDRNAYTVVTQPLGIAPSPIVTPTHDLFGQLRGDDPDQASAPGLGLNVFKDRGAIERIDRSAPTARLIGPLDQATQAPLDDKDSSVDSVRLEGREARGVRQFVIQLEDIGVGIDRVSVVPDAITVLRDGAELTDGLDYFFQFNANTNQIILASTVVFELGDYVVELRPDVAYGQLVDLAGNQLLANANEGGEFFTSFAISLADVPSAPTGVKAMAANGVAQLEWNAPNTSPSTPIERYDIEYSLDGGQNWQGWSPAGGGDVTASPVEVPWPNNEDRLYRVRGVNSVGTGLGAWSVDVAATASQPLNVVGTPGLEEVSLAWATPVNNGGQSITSYVIDRRPAGGTSADDGWIRVSQEPSTTSVTVTGLEKGVAQEFRVAAKTAAGQGEWSEVSAAITPEGVPDVPTNLASAIEPDGAITLTWTIPSDGGTPITAYEVSYSDGSTTATDTVQTNQITLNSLVRGMDYTIHVRVKNVHGLGGSSEALQVTAPDIIANGPIIMSVQPGLDSLVISWRAPTLPAGDLPVIDYVVQTSLDQVNWTTQFDGFGVDTTATIADLDRTDGDHFVRVAARNGISGVADDDLNFSGVSGPVRPLTLASGVQNLAGIHGDSQVALSWDQPADTGGAAVTDYVIEYQDANGWQIFNEGVRSTTSAIVTGLANGTSYQFRVTAVTAAGQGATVVTDPLVPLGAPTAVTGLQASIEIEQSTLTWLAPSSDGGQAISAYRIEYSTSATGPWLVFAGDGDPADLTATVTGLVKQTQYFFRVSAQNTQGIGIPSGIVSVTPIGPPDQPAGLSFLPDQTDGSLQMSWTAPANTGDLPISYEIEYVASGSDWSAADSFPASTASTDLEGLTPGISYDLRIRAVNSAGQSPWLAASRVAPDVPAAPTGLTASVVAGQSGVIRLLWTPPSIATDELRVIDYVVQESLDNGVTWTTLDNGQNTATSYQITGLTRGDGERRYRVAAKNVLPGVVEADLRFTPASAAVRPLGLSQAVQNLQATAQDRRIVLQWTSPADSGGVLITDYLVEIHDGFGWQTFADAVTSATGATINGLVNGLPYGVRVTPQTSLGYGEAETLAGVVPYGVPAAPFNLGVVEGFGQLEIDWDAGADNGAAITDYVIEYSSSLNAPWEQYLDGTSAATSTVLSDLPSGVGLYIRVAGRNAAGTGSYSAVVGPLVMGAVPTMPTGLVAQSLDDGRIELSWQAPVNDGGSAITDYIVEYRRSEGTVWSAYGDGAGNGRTAIVNGFPRAFGPYIFRVRAVNFYGQSSASPESSAVAPFAAPGKVEGLLVEPADSAIAVSWISPSDNGGAAVNDYVIQYSSTGGASWVTVADGSGTDTSTVLSGLSNGTSYLVRVFAGNSVRYGAPQQAGPVMPVAQPDAPVGLQVTANSGTASLAWTAPAVTGGLPVIDYVIEYRATGDQNAWLLWNDGVTATPAAIVSGLTNDSAYEFRVAARTAAGVGEVVQSESVLIGPRAAAPTRFSGSLENGVVRLRWVAPVTSAAYPITDYRVEYRANGVGAWSEAVEQPGSGDPTDVLSYVTGLEPGIAYQFRVAAVTVIGVGNYAVYEPLLVPTA